MLPVHEDAAVALHDDEYEIDLALVRALVGAALPQYAGLPLTPLPEQGSSNALFRLGDELLVRLPRQPGGSQTIDKEARWVPRLAPALPVAVPDVVAVGQPAWGYPERWSVVRWIDGERPEVAGRGEATGSQLAADLAGLVRALRECAVPAEALADPALRWYRGEPLPDRAEAFREDLRACRGISGLDLDLDAAEVVWEQALSLPAGPVRTSWYHGDLFAENLLVRGGRLVAALDFGGLSVGDPAVDLAGAWEVLDAAGREVFRTAVGAGDDEWHRGRAWALSIALMTLPYYWDSMPGRCASRVAAARAVLQDAGGA